MATSKKTNKKTSKPNWLSYMDMCELEKEYKDTVMARFTNTLTAKGKDPLRVLGKFFPRFHNKVANIIAHSYYPFIINDGRYTITSTPVAVEFNNKYDTYVIKVEVKTYDEETRQADCYTEYRHNYDGRKDEKATLCQHIYDMADDIAQAARDCYSDLERKYNEEHKKGKK